MKKIKIIFTDLDGTILPHNRPISQTDLETFNLLQQKDVIKVIATGRTLHSLKNVISLDFPIDYVIFSSGAGIINWHNQQLIQDYNLPQSTIKEITKILLDLDQNFLIYDPIPHNHYFQYYQSTSILTDFANYLTRNRKFSRPFDHSKFNQSATQALTMLKTLDSFYHLQKLLNQLNLKIIRATSPIDHQTIWMEFFNPAVSKGNAANFLCQKLGIDPQFSLGIGNDFNDIDLLNFTHYSYVVDNAPLELKQQYQITASVDHNGFSKIIYDLLDIKNTRL